MNRYQFISLLIFLSLVTFVVTGVSNTFGYAWCFGADGHASVEQASANGCKDRDEGCSALAPLKTFGQPRLDQEHCQPCKDFIAGQADIILPKRQAKVPRITLTDSIKVAGFAVPEFHARQPKFLSGSLRVSNAILAHRTVVLLN
jgi:hypothetical protein